MDYNTIKLTVLKQPVYDFFIVPDGGFMIALEDKNNLGSLYFQIYSQLKDDIQSGKLKAGTKLLSKRKMAERLSVSVNTVETAYSQLVSEGFIEAEAKRGYFVCKIDRLNIDNKPKIENEPDNEYNKGNNIIVDFATDGVDGDNFPYNTWRKLMKNCFNEYNPDILKSAPPEGDYKLRKAVAGHIYASRGVNCSVNQVIIGAGVDNLLNIISGIMGIKSKIAMENPVYYEAYSLFKSLGHEIISIPVDDKGMRTDMLPEEDSIIVYVTPSHQFPLGITMPAGRRVKLMNWAYETENRYIIEDDYDSEFRYNSKLIPSVQSIDRKGRVIYLGTLSKTIAPSVRISYMVLPNELLKRYNEKYRKFSSAVSVLEQNMVTEFITEGYYERHLNRMRKLYGEKRTVLLAELKKFGSAVKLNGENAGHHMAVKLTNGTSEADMVRLAENVGVKVYPLSKYFVDKVPDKYKSTVLIGYATLSVDKIKTGAELLRGVWTDNI